MQTRAGPDAEAVVYPNPALYACPAGNACPAGTAQPVPCARGYYRASMPPPASDLRYA